MRLTRLAAYLLGCAAFALSCLAYTSYIYMLGFPDGSITELGYAERRLAYIFIGISLVSGLSFVYLGIIAGRKLIGKRLSLAVVLYLISIICLLLIDNYYRLHLMDGTGG